MEAAVSNVLAVGEKAILCTAGRWGERFRGILKAFGANIVAVEVPYGKAVTPKMLQKALRDNPDTKAVFATLSETSTGVGHDIAAFGQIVAKTDALLVVDGISGVGAMECRMDDWNIDVLVTGSQKALMLPPGLAFVGVSGKGWKKIDATPVRNFYFDLRRYRKSLAEGPDTPFTPANTLIRAQRTSLKRIRAEGIENLWASAREDRGGLPGWCAGDGAGSLRRAAEQRADGHHGARCHRRQRPRSRNWRNNTASNSPTARTR
jgi:serine---pyruvate transaminase